MINSGQILSAWLFNPNCTILVHCVPRLPPSLTCILSSCARRHVSSPSRAGSRSNLSEPVGSSSTDSLEEKRPAEVVSVSGVLRRHVSLWVVSVSGVLRRHVGLWSVSGVLRPCQGTAGYRSLAGASVLPSCLAHIFSTLQTCTSRCPTILAMRHGDSARRQRHGDSARRQRHGGRDTETSLPASEHSDSLVT